MMSLSHSFATGAVSAATAGVAVAARNLVTPRAAIASQVCRAPLASRNASTVAAAASPKPSPISKPFLSPSNDKELEGTRPIYLDLQATTPVDPRVLEKMLPCFKEKFGNCHSRTHQFGWETEKMVEEARAEIAQLVGAQPKEIIYTSGATESNNLAIKGLAQFYGKQRGCKHAISLQTEHKCVLASLQWLEQHMGWSITYLPVGKDGLVDLKELEAAIRPDTCFISAMMVNNEIGVIQPMKEIGEIARKHKVFFHVDAAQAAGKIPIDVNALNIDAMSMSAHKIYGPKGIGALYLRSKPRVRLVPQMSGGGQERGMRSGTLPVPLCVGFGEAARLCRLEMVEDEKRIRALAQRFIQSITSRLEGVVLNGSPDHRFPGNCNLSFDCVEGESLLMAMKYIAVSSGSACTSSSLEPSYVLRALGVDEELAHTSIRFGIGRFTTEEEVDFAADKVVEAVKKLREISPLWELKQQGANLKSQMVWT